MTKEFLLTIILTSVFVTNLPGQSAEKVRFTSVPVTKNIYLIQVDGQWNYDNIVALVGKDGILLVDNGFPETEKALREILRPLSPEPVKFIINTHFHHAGANAAFAREATIIAHHSLRNRMKMPLKMYGQIPIGPWEEFALPKVTFNNEMTINFNDEEIRIVHFPNVHTDGDVVVFFTKSNVVATGDFFVPLLAICDLANGCRWSAFLDGLKTLLKIIPKDAKIIPGHYKLSTYQDLKNVSQMLEEVTELVRKQIKAGRTLEQIKAKGIPERWRSWETRGINADFFLTNVYDGIKSEKER